MTQSYRRRVGRVLIGLLTLGASCLFLNCFGWAWNRPPCVATGKPTTLDFELAFTWLPEGTRNTRIAFLQMKNGTIETRINIYERRCAEVTAAEGAELLRHVAVFALEKPFQGFHGGRELVTWRLRDGSHGLVAAEDLSPKAIASMKEIACFAVARVPKLTKIAIGGATPKLAERLGFPESCPAIQEGGAEVPADA